MCIDKFTFSEGDFSRKKVIPYRFGRTKQFYFPQSPVLCLKNFVNT